MCSKKTTHCYECNGKLKHWAERTEMFIHTVYISGLFYSRDMHVIERHLYSLESLSGFTHKDSLSGFKTIPS